MPIRHARANRATVITFASRVRLTVTLCAALVFSHALAQIIRPDPGGGGDVTPIPGGGGGVILPIPGGGGGGIIPPGGIGPGGGNTGGNTPNAVISAPRGALVGETVEATTTIVQAPTTGTAPPLTATYQWTITGGRLTSDARSPSVQFVADRDGTVTLSVAVNSNIGSFNPSAQLTILAADAAGAITAPTTVAANAPPLTASVPAARNNDRTFRWTVSGDAAIASGQGTRTATFRPGSPGLKEIVCNVTLQNLVTVPVRSYLVVTGTGTPTVVTVNQGTGGGTFPAGSRVDIFADPPTAGHVFDRWTGDTEVIGGGALAPLFTHTVITVPTTPVTLTATYKPAPAWTPVVLENFNPQPQPNPATNQPASAGSTLTYHIPGDAVGLVFLLHQTGASGADWFNRPEHLLLARDLVAAGYGVAALGSFNRTTAAWATQATLPTNPDALNHAAAHDHFVRTDTLAATKPVFFLGVAAGANAALRYADLLARTAPVRPVKGAVLYLASGIDTLAVTSRVPQFFALATHDDALGAAGITAARDRVQLLLGRGVATGTSANGVSPVHAGRFRALALNTPAFTPADADAVWTAVKTAGYLDANNYPISVPTVAALAPALPSAHRERASDVAAQLAIAAASGEFFSDANPRIIQFLNARAAEAPVPQPGRLANLSMRAKVAHLTDTFTLGFTLTGTQRATLLIRGIGPTLTRFGVRDPLLAPRLELIQASRVIASNEGWEKNTNPSQIAAAAAAVGAFALAPGSLDAALLVQLDAGTYTATLRGLGGTAGDVLAEIYDISRNATRLTNLSTLSHIHNDGELLIPGIVILGNTPRTLVVRAVANGLTDFGHSADNVLGDPRLVLLNRNQTVAQNNNWAQPDAGMLTALFPAIGAFPLRAANDAALLEAIPPGNYTLQAGATPLPALPPGTSRPATFVAPHSTGLLLVEVYEVP